MILDKLNYTALDLGAINLEEANAMQCLVLARLVFWGMKYMSQPFYTSYTLN